MSYIIVVALPVPLYNTFDYSYHKIIAIGIRVKVKFAGRELIGIVVANKNTSIFKTLTINKVLDANMVLSAEMLKLIIWSADYFQQPIGEMIFAAIPKNIRLGKELCIKKTLTKNKLTTNKIILTSEQQQAIDNIIAALNTYQAFLLHGVTGSGKTEVYIQISKKVLAANKQILILVPEIGLTPQMITIFSTRLDAKIAIIHSKLNETQKLDNYLSAKNLTADIVLGTRSAIFSEMPNLGLIIIDEEHDNSFRQQSSPRYNAKTIAFIRAKNNNIPIILGSATPSLISLKNVIDKKLKRLLLTKRIGSAIMPKISIIDSHGTTDAISSHLLTKIKEHINNNKQVLLFINRRGYAPIYYCTNCDWRLLCNDCDKAMVYHIDSNKLKCHLCAKITHMITTCPQCDTQSLTVLGYGTQRLEQNLTAKFNNCKIIRIDRDSTNTKFAFEKKISLINNGNPCIIIGTQMLAKGHDFANITLVGILNSDSSILSSDFNAIESLAQLLIQVSGRAGRANNKGEVIIQTDYPSHNIFSFIKNSNYIGFAKKLLLERKEALMPPFIFAATICANSKKQQLAKDFLLQCKQILHNIVINNIRISDVMVAIIAKKANYYYYNLYIYSDSRKNINAILKTLIKNIPKNSANIRYFIEVDPL